MVTIHIAEHVQYASSYSDGQVIYDLVAPPLQRGEAVELSFAGFPAVPSAFINAALVQLLEILSADQVRKQLRILDSTKYNNELIKRRFDFVVSRQASSSRLPGCPAHA